MLPEIYYEAPTQTIADGIQRTARYISQHDNIVCCISGGADSDCMLHILTNIDTQCKIRYYYFDTGIEMQATKNHLEYLKSRYSVDIITKSAKIKVARACRIHGVPFLSKKISDNIDRLQRHGFDFSDRPFSELYAEYPNCKSALRWWCNAFGDKSRMNIERNKGLKEFLIENPPDFAISPKCCDCAKKAPAHEIETGCDLSIIGIRRSEGGARATAYHSCFEQTKTGNKHFPLFYWTDTDRHMFEQAFDIKHSAAYTEYGCKRTGCSGCPFGSGFETEIEMLHRFEPKLYTAANAVFAKSYEYTRKYRAFKGL